MVESKVKSYLLNFSLKSTARLTSIGFEIEQSFQLTRSGQLRIPGLAKASLKKMKNLSQSTCVPNSVMSVA